MKNKILIATSKIPNGPFHRKAVFAKNEFDGIVLNGHIVGFVEPNLEPNLNLAHSKFNVYFGGPFDTHGMFFIHGFRDFASLETNNSEFDLGIPSSFDDFSDIDHWGLNNHDDDFFTIIEGVYFGQPTDFQNILKSSFASQLIDKSKFLYGCIKWEPEQLQKEIELGLWEVMDSSSELIFNNNLLEKHISRLNPDKPKPKFSNWSLN